MNPLVDGKPAPLGRWLALCQNCVGYRLYPSQQARDSAHNADSDVCACSDCVPQANVAWNVQDACQCES